MLDTQPLPCTRLPSDRYRTSLLHYSMAMRLAESGIGMVGMTLCGLREALDQTRANLLSPTRVRFYELSACLRCESALTAMGLLNQARAALGVLVGAPAAKMREDTK
jgi:hypothetical protein